MKNIFLVFVGLFSVSVGHADKDIEYVIQSGEHASSPSTMGLFQSKKMQFQATFNESAQYKFAESAVDHQSDINKLFGFSDCGDSHSKNSARIGWRWMNGKLHVLALTHHNDNISYQELGTCESQKAYDFSIEISPDRSKYIYQFGNMKVEMDRGCSTENANGYLLKPYFGGEEVAPQQISIQIGYEDPFANFSVSPPYPSPTSENFINIDVCSPVEQNIGYRIFDLVGKVLQVIEPISYSADPGFRKQRLELDSDISNGLYILRPYAKYSDGTEKGAMPLTSGDALKIMIQK